MVLVANKSLSYLILSYILLSKLKLNGIRGNSLKWFVSYLKSRNQICSVNCKLSSAREIGCGVPQGSNLGPIIFLLYINDLPNCLESTKANLFADDTNLTCEGLSPHEIETKLKKDIENVHRWLTANREFKLRVSGNGKRQIRTFFAKFPLKVFVSYFLSCVERINMHCSFQTANSFTLYCLIP
jgi:hypothetical protein